MSAENGNNRKGSERPGSGSADSAFDSDLFSTAAAFNSRFQRQKQSHDQELTAAEQAAKERHKQMHQLLAGIRKSLEDLRKIQLGDRFSLLINTDEWRGWPRIAVKLQDKLFASRTYPMLVVCGNDKQERGLIEFHLGDAITPTSRPQDQLSVAIPANGQRLPWTLKRNVRRFLDIIAKEILAAEKNLKSHLEENRLHSTNLAEFEEEKKPRQKAEEKALSGDLFEEEFHKREAFEVLPTLDDISSLPGMDDPFAAKSKARAIASAETPKEKNQKEKGSEKRPPTARQKNPYNGKPLDDLEEQFLAQLLEEP